jgi:hypothetical protein
MTENQFIIANLQACQKIAEIFQDDIARQKLANNITEIHYGSV